MDTAPNKSPAALARHYGKRAPLESLNYSVEEMGEVLGISRSAAFSAVRNGTIPSLRLGRRTLVPKIAVHRLVDEALASKPKVA